MQLFITEYQLLSPKKITINNKEILDQIRKVLRGKIGDKFFIQNPSFDIPTEIRYECEIIDWDKKSLTAKIINEEKYENHENYKNNEKETKKTIMLVAMSNKRPKAELIAQKLTEIGINEIIFWNAERSVIKQKNENKFKRIHNITKEASEQARRRTLPKIDFVEKAENINAFFNKENSNIYIFDIPRNKREEENNESISSTNKNNIWIVGPEWWLTEKDYKQFWDNYTIKSLGNTVLRTETASILAWREIKKNSK